MGLNRAVKYVPASRIIDPTQFYREPQTLIELEHENIVRVVDAGTEIGNVLYIAMEYLKRKSLEDIFKGKPAPPKTARRYLCDACWGIEYAHRKRFIHRDIKPANILVGDDGTAKISDFGLATRVPTGSTGSAYGYLTHLAPEVFTRGITSVQTDVYALGVTAYRLFNGDSHLDTSLDADDLERRITAGQYPDRSHYRPYLPENLRRIINKAMRIDPSERFQSAQAFRRALEAVRIQCTWGWTWARNQVTYRTTIGTSRIKVIVREKQNGSFQITATKKIGNGSARKIAKDCATDLILEDMKRTLHRILARYTSDGK